ncbi:MAG: hypothetical protein BGO95_02220 [Micrococcales bacterium 73-13]|nr:MAG: hypothetical protein BGO95_02220 [Micrococcales bacterium 73-13]
MNAVPTTPTRLNDLELLRQHAEELWERQQEVFATAAHVAREAGQQGAAFARDEVAPRVRQAASTGASAVRSAYGRAVPVASSAIATAAAIGDQGVRLVLARLARARAAAAAPVVAPARRGIGVGGWIGITVGVLAAGAVAYAVWQTLRADDDLWIEDEEPVDGAAVEEASGE